MYRRRSAHPAALGALLVSASSAFALLLLSSAAAAQVATPSPFIERLEPNSGPPGTVVEMIGRHFRPDQVVSVGGVAVEVRTRLPNRWTVVIPAGATTGNVIIRLTDRTTVSGPEFRVTEALPPPVVTSIAPTTATPGSEVHVAGSGFSPRLADDTVTLNGAPCVVAAASPTELIVVVPVDAASGPLLVRIAGAGEVSSPTLTISAGLTVTALTPSTIAPGMELTITGTGFDARANRNRVSIGGVPLRVRTASATSLVVTVPATAVSGTVVVEPRGGGRAVSAATLLVRPMPTISSIEPARGTIGARVRVLGTGFGTDIRAVSATLGGVAMIVRALTDTDISVEIPTGAVSGPVSVTAGGLPAVESTAALSVLIPLSVVSFSPISGPVGTEVTILGAGFSTTLADNRVTLSGAACVTLAATPTELRVRMPAAASGPLAVEVAEAGSTRTSQPFVVTTPPSISSFEPIQGAAGTVVHIVGATFGTNASLVEVTIGGVRMEVRSVTPTAIDAVVPAAGVTGPIVVAVRLQGSATSSNTFRVLGDFAVVGAEALTGYPGQELVVRGRGFTLTTTARVAGTATDAMARAISPTELRVTVPEGAASGSLVVHADDGREASIVFTLAPDPEGAGIGRVVPTCTARGCTILIYGWGFGTTPRALTVTVHGRAARVRRVSVHVLEVSVPRRAGVGAVHVVLRDGPTLDSADFPIE